MIIQITVDSALPDLSAHIGRDTFGRILQITRPKDTNLDLWRRVGSPFGAAYALHLVDESSVHPNVLYVSPGVKTLFYPTRSELNIPEAG